MNQFFIRIIVYDISYCPKRNRIRFPIISSRSPYKWIHLKCDLCNPRSQYSVQIAIKRSRREIIHCRYQSSFIFLHDSIADLTSTAKTFLWCFPEWTCPCRSASTPTLLIIYINLIDCRIGGMVDMVDHLEIMRTVIFVPAISNYLFQDTSSE